MAVRVRHLWTDGRQTLFALCVRGMREGRGCRGCRGCRRTSFIGDAPRGLVATNQRCQAPPCASRRSGVDNGHNRNLSRARSRLRRSLLLLDAARALISPKLVWTQSPAFRKIVADVLRCAHEHSLSLMLICLTLAAVPAVAGVVYDDGPINGNVDAFIINFRLCGSATPLPFRAAPAYRNRSFLRSVVASWRRCSDG